MNPVRVRVAVFCDTLERLYLPRCAKTSGLRRDLWTGLSLRNAHDAKQFIAIKDGRIVCIQVADEMFSDQTRERELTPLVSIKDNYEKTIVVRQGSYDSDIGGIRIMGAREFFLEP